MSKKAIDRLGRDPVLRRIMDETKLRRRKTDGDVYAFLIRSIVYQQLSGKAAATIYSRFLDLFDDQYPHPANVVQLTSERMGKAGLSRQKTEYIRNAATYWTEHKLGAIRWKTQSDEEIVELLTQIKGVGTWTAQMILMFALRRPDIFPLHDLGIRNAIVKHYRLRSKGQRLDRRLLEIADTWRPYRTLACCYLWQSLEKPPPDRRASVPPKKSGRTKR